MRIINFNLILNKKRRKLIESNCIVIYI